LPHQFVECRATGLLLRGDTAFESGAGMVVVEARPRLSFHRRSKLALERIGDKGRELGGDQRHAHDRNEKERGGGGEAPDNDLGP
jgi:hypothetical protein